MCFYLFFARFWVSYRVFLGRLPFIFGDYILYKCTYLSIFAIVKITLHITVRTYGWYRQKYTLILSY